jgi:hypothetical protein
MLISDADFKDADKSSKRLDLISKATTLSKSSAKSCLENILRFSVEQKDEKNEKYVKFRMSEIFKVLNN